MPKCPACGKEVYFAERKTSLGKDWHASCLKCARCKKTLAPGSHAEIIEAEALWAPDWSHKHEGKPYCHVPCYSATFGPKGFGRGGTESHDYDQ